MLKSLLVISLIIILLMANNCATAVIPEAENFEPVVVSLTMKDHYFEPATLHFKAGQRIQLDMVNHGLIEHDLLIGLELERYRWDQTVVKDFFAGLTVKPRVQQGRFKADMQRGSILQLETGGKATLTFTVPHEHRGTWEFACFITGHYEAGMKGLLIVE